MSADMESASLLGDLTGPGTVDLLPDVRQSRGFLEPEPEPEPQPQPQPEPAPVPAPVPVALVAVDADTAEPDHQASLPAAAVAALPAAADGAATCAEKLEMLGMLLASPCPSSTITPPPGRLQLPLPADGFMCDQCGDRFVLPSSLAQHQQRRSMRVTLNCPMCQALVVFNNKCQLLEHLDAHKIDPVSIDPALIDAAALSAAELGVEPLAPTPTPTPAPAGAAKRQVKPPPLINKIDRPVRVSCPMCNQLCSTLTLAEHLCPAPETDDSPLPAPPPRCPDCDQPCPTECSLMAHQGLHKPDLWPYPYACPECGVKILGSHDQALQHVVAGCLHMTRDVKNCCAICREEVTDAKGHMVQSHVQKLYKCRRCPLAFESTNGFNSHLAEKHGGILVAGESPFMLILKCPFCAATFNNANALKEHMGSRKHGERVLQQVSFVFRCPECEQDFAAKPDLAQHLSKQHADFKPVSMILPLRSAEPPPPPMPPPARHIGRPKTARGSLGPGETPPRVSRGPVSYSCIVCKTDFKRKPEFTEHARSHLREGVPLCLLCNTRFGSTQMLKNHLGDHAAEAGRDRCGLCYAKLTTAASLQFHLEGEHGLRTFDCIRCNLSYERLTDLNRHNFAVHRNSTRGPRRELPPPNLNAADMAGMDDADHLLPPLPVATKRPLKIDQDAEAQSLIITEQAAKRQRVGVQVALPAEPPLHLQLEEEEGEDHDGETLEEIASFVAGGGRPAQFVVEEEPTDAEAEAEEVIELEINEGEITAKQSEAHEAPEEPGVPEMAEEAEYIMPDLDGAGAPHTPPEMRDIKPDIVAAVAAAEEAEADVGLAQ